MKILAVQNRKGIGDTIIFLPFFKEISEKYSIPVDILVRDSSKSEEYLTDTKYINAIHILERNDQSNGKHDGLLGAINLIKYLKDKNFDKIFIFNSSFRFNLIARCAGIKEIYQYPLFEKNKQHRKKAAKFLLEISLNIKKFDDPSVEINKNEAEKLIAKFNFNKDDLNFIV